MSLVEIFSVIFVDLLASNTTKILQRRNHSHSCKFARTFFVPAKIPGHGTVYNDRMISMLRVAQLWQIKLALVIND